MKKFLAILLALATVTTISLTACNKKDKTEDEGDDWDNDFYNSNQDTDDTSDTSDTDEAGNNGEENNGGTTSGAWNELAAPETVYVLQSVYLRNSAKDNDKSGISLNQDAQLTRTAISSDGKWAKVTYNSATYYIYNFIVSTSKINFATVDRVATTVINNASTGEDQYYLRTTPCIASASKWGTILNNVGATVKKSDTADGKLVVTGYDAANECARVEYDADGAGEGQPVTYYIFSPNLELYNTSSGGNTGNTPV